MTTSSRVSVAEAHEEPLDELMADLETNPFRSVPDPNGPANWRSVAEVLQERFAVLVAADKQVVSQVRVSLAALDAAIDDVQAALVACEAATAGALVRLGSAEPALAALTGRVQALEDAHNGLTAPITHTL